MAKKNNTSCGPNAVDRYDDYYTNSRGDSYRSHSVDGTGVMTDCNATDYGSYRDTYDIKDGITELADKCLSKRSIDSVSLPNSLVKTGSECFRNSTIKYITLPESLEEMGHENFPATLQSITLPANLRIFPSDNFVACEKLTSISVHEDNKYFKTIDGILYNHDVTEILICPRGKSGKVIIPKTVKRIADFCFFACEKITSIELPHSIETIGRRAFRWSKLDRLIVPNSVIEIGEGCFSNTTISKKFRFSQKISFLPDCCFQEANIPNADFLKNIKEIGDNCFERINQKSLPSKLILPKIKRIGEHAFDSARYVKSIELPSCIQHIGEHAFNYTADDLKII